jgi:hypothetical protein
MDLATNERRFEYLQSMWTEGSIEVVLFDDAGRSEAFEALSNFFSEFRDDAEIFKNLKQILAHIHWDLRGFTGSSEVSQVRWADRLDSLRNELASVKIHMSEETQHKALILLEKIKNLQESDSNYAQAIESMLASSEDILLVVEKPRLRSAIANFVTSLCFSKYIAIISLDSLVKEAVPKTTKVVILAAPRKVSENFMRVLTLGAPASSITFLTPNWLVGPSPQKISQDLAKGLPGLRKQAMRVSGPLFSRAFQENGIEEYEQTYLFESGHSYKKYISRGSSDCRLIHLAGGYVMPLEMDAKLIYVLTQTETGNLEVKPKKPFSTLENGDIIFDLRNGVDDTFLVELAEVRMGVRFSEYSHIRGIMKSRLEALISKQGKKATIEFLNKSKVSTAKHIDEWLQNEDFTTLRSNKDWHNLLVALEFSTAEVRRFEELGGELRSTLISIGANARLQMAESVSSREWERVLQGEIVTKRLDDYGDADFILALVVSVDTSSSKCEPEDIRKVMEG